MKQRAIVTIGIVLGLLAARPAEAPAQSICPGIDGELVAMSDEAITVSSTAIGFTAGKIRIGALTARVAVFSTETNSVRYRVEGDNPTSSVGHLVVAGSHAAVCGLQPMTAFRAIRVSGDATLYVTYYRRR